MAPPKFADFTKIVSDLFKEDFGFGETKLVLKSKAQNGVAFKVEGVRPDAGVASGFLETKFAHSSGLNVKEKWTTKNDVTTEVSLDTKFLEGSKVTAEAVFNPNSGVRDLKLKGDYAADHVNANVTVTGKGILSTSSVFSYASKFLFGASADYDTSKGAVSATKFSVGYTESDVAVTSTITNGADVEGTVYHTPNSSVQAGLKFTWSKANPETGFELVGKYKIDGESFVKAKVDKALNIGLSFTQQLKKGVTLTLSANVKGANLNTDAHQLGLTLALEQ